MTYARIQLVTRFGRKVNTTVQECTEHAKAQELRFALGMEGKKSWSQDKPDAKKIIESSVQLAGDRR